MALSCHLSAWTKLREYIPKQWQEDVGLAECLLDCLPSGTVAPPDIYHVPIR